MRERTRVVPADQTRAIPLTAQQEYSATLTEHAQLPAQTFLAPPADAPAMFNVSGRFTGGARVEQLYGIFDETTGLARPFPGQPLQGFSGIRSLGDDRFLVLTDNGFGNKMNSADVLLMFNTMHVEWDSGRVMPWGKAFWAKPYTIEGEPYLLSANGFSRSSDKEATY